jgi:hypothetical protein
MARQLLETFPSTERAADAKAEQTAASSSSAAAAAAACFIFAATRLSGGAAQGAVEALPEKRLP